MANLEMLILKPAPVMDPSKKGNFEAMVNEKTLTLFVREDVYKVVDGFNYDAALFYSTVVGFPTWFKAALGWSLEDVSNAAKILKKTLKGYVDDKVLEQDIFQLRKYGAMPPDSKEK